MWMRWVHTSHHVNSTHLHSLAYTHTHVHTHTHTHTHTEWLKQSRVDCQLLTTVARCQYMSITSTVHHHDLSTRHKAVLHSMPCFVDMRSAPLVCSSHLPHVHEGAWGVSWKTVAPITKSRGHYKQPWAHCSALRRVDYSSVSELYICICFETCHQRPFYCAQQLKHLALSNWPKLPVVTKLAELEDMYGSIKLQKTIRIPPVIIGCRYIQGHNYKQEQKAWAPANAADLDRGFFVFPHTVVLQLYLAKCKFPKLRGKILQFMS